MASTAANAQTRTLKLLNVHTGEKASITYRRGSSYDSAGLKKINYIMRDWRKNQPTKMNTKVLDVLWEVYRNTGASGYINVVCGYRSPATNSMLRKRSRGVANKSQHMLGNAIDFYIPGVKLKTLRNAGLALQAGGVGYYPSSGSPFVHMDVGRVRTWGPTSQAEVAMAIKNGKRFGSSGGSVVAFAEEKSRSKGLLAALFGGGADEEEDNAEIETPKAKAVAAKPAKAPAGDVPGVTIPDIKVVPPELASPAEIPAEQPEEVVETPETIIASLSTRKIPLPGFAPRPEADVGPDEASASELVALIQQSETALPPQDVERTASTLASAGNVTAVPGERPADEALGIPLPSWRPSDGQPSAQQPDATTLLALAADETPARASDALAVMPASRPDALAGSTTAEMAGTIPRPAGKSGRLGAKAAVAVAQPVKTTPKTARPSRADSKPEPKPVVVAAQPNAARWALTKDYVVTASTRTTAPSYAYNIVRSAPVEVYTAGFQTGPDEGDINRFTGKAVKFLQVARFEAQ